MELLSGLRRRWILASLLLLVTLAGTAYALFKLPSTYQSQSSIVFLVPKNVTKSLGGNPYLAFNSTLNQTADVVRYETQDVRTVDMLAAQGYSSKYLVTDAIDTSGPVLIVTVTGHNKELVEHTLRGVTTEVNAKLDTIQAGLSNANKIRDVVITFTPNATPLTSKKARPLAALAAAGFMLTVGIPLIVDAVLLRRRRMQEIEDLDEDNIKAYRLDAESLEIPNGTTRREAALPRGKAMPPADAGRLPRRPERRSPGQTARRP